MSDSAKNCYSCQHLEWVDGEDESSTGFDCNKRHTTNMGQRRESSLLNQLDSEKYRNQYKRCYEIKATP